MGAPRLSSEASSCGPESQIPDKLYFKIGEVAALVGVEPHVLRYWQKEIAAVRPGKSPATRGRYRRREIELFREIRRLLHHDKYTLAGAKRRLQASAERGLQKGGPLSSQANVRPDDHQPEFTMPDLLSDVLNDPELMLLPEQSPPPSAATSVSSSPQAPSAPSAPSSPSAPAAPDRASVTVPASRGSTPQRGSSLAPKPARSPAAPRSAPRAPTSPVSPPPAPAAVRRPVGAGMSAEKRERLRKGLRDLIRISGEQA